MGTYQFVSCSSPLAQTCEQQLFFWVSLRLAATSTWPQASLSIPNIYYQAPSELIYSAFSPSHARPASSSHIPPKHGVAQSRWIVFYSWHHSCSSTYQHRDCSCCLPVSSLISARSSEDKKFTTWTCTTINSCIFLSTHLAMSSWAR